MMTKNTFSNFDTPTQIAEQQTKADDSKIKMLLLKYLCDKYSVFLRSDEYECSTNQGAAKAACAMCDHEDGIALAAMEVYHPGTKEFIEFLESE